MLEAQQYSNLGVAGYVDCDNEIELEIWGELAWINAPQATALIEHLQHVFALPVPTMVQTEVVYSSERVGDRK